MANTTVEFDSFTHSAGAGCACPGCCLDLAGKADVDGPLDRPGGPSATAIEKLIELGLDEVLERGQWMGDIPQRADQQATAGSFPYDSDQGDADQGVDGLISGIHWNETALTYSFPTSASDYESNYYNSGALGSLSGFSATQQAVSREIFDQYAEISGLSFTELGDDFGEQRIDADLRLALSNDPSTAYAYYPSTNPVGGDAMFNPNGYNSPQIGNYQYHTFLHEIGHALGLKHGHETSGPGAVPFEMDSMEYTVMTYRSWVGKPLSYGYANEGAGYAQSLMMLDIAAIQRMYGADFGANSGDTVYTFSTTTGEMFVDGIGSGTPAGNRVFRTIWDGNGTDTYDFSNYATDLAINLEPGEYVELDANGNFQRAMLDFGYAGNPVTYARGHVFNALQFNGDARSLIENANGGAGDDTFVGNAADNVFQGNGGNDTFFASAGADTYYGGAGTDDIIYDDLFSNFSFTTSGSFLQVINGAVDLIADTVETVFFSDQSWTFSDLFSFAGGSGNAAPDAVNDGYAVAEDAALNGNVLGNDSDPDGDPLSVTAVNGQAVNVGSQITLASGALLTVNADGTFSYGQNGAFDGLDTGQTGNDSFTYTASDGSATDQATVTITVNGATDNAAPDAFDDGYAVAEGAALGGDLLSNDSDPNGDPLTVTAINGQAANVDSQIMLASGALLTVNANGTFSYDQNGAFDGLNNGQTGNDSFTYTAGDGSATDQATVSITINGATDNGAPSAADDSYAVDEGAGLGGDVLGNDSDPDGDPLTVTAINGQAVNVGSQIALASGALLTVNASGTFSYDQNGAFDALNDGETGNDSFTYTISDGQGGTDTATVNITVNGAGTLSGPAPMLIDFEGAAPGPYAGSGGLAFSGLDVQANSAMGGARLGSTGPDGDATITATGEDFDFDSALFRSVDGRARVTVQAWDDGVQVGQVSFRVRSDRDKLREFNAQFDSIDEVRIIANEEILIDDLNFIATGGGAPDPGPDPDPGPGNNAPTALDDAASTAESAIASGNALTNDTDPDGDALTVTTFAGGTGAGGSATLASGATVTMLSDGTFDYDPNGAFDALNAGENAADSFDYVISDGNGGTDTGTVNVTITGEGGVVPNSDIFEDFEDGVGESGLVFTNTVLTSQDPGVVSGSQAGASTGDQIIFSMATSFDFESAYFTAATRNKTKVKVQGYLDGQQVSSESFTIFRDQEKFRELNDSRFDNVDQVVITASGGLILDDISLLL
ncbi:MAG: Ig-like domain-containing protein [Paracoccaceae bacterium]|nr:Ig-like domain-containing protein [Paracoccaceae bacterium]